MCVCWTHLDKTWVGDLQHADVRIMRRAQWFLISLPMLRRPGVQRWTTTVVAAWAVECVLEPGSAMSVVVIHALPLCCEESFRAQWCGVEVEGCVYV
jgi:hypothetical protein